MKLIRSLFQAAMLTVFMGTLSQNLLAIDYRDIPVDKSVVAQVHSAAGQVTHLSASAILTGLGSEFVDGIISLVTIALVGMAFWLVLPQQRVEVQIGEELPVEIPPFASKYRSGHEVLNPSPVRFVDALSIAPESA